MKKSIALSLIALFTIGFVWLASATSPTSATQTGKPDKPVNVTKKPLIFENVVNVNPGVYTLDHFLVYRVNPAQLNIEVRLRGQFDPDFLPARLTGRDRFLNPVEKNGEPILNRFAHLNWYRIQAPPEPVRTLSIFNQFGQQVLVIGDPVALLAPAEKVEPGSEFPKGLDHYKVYRVLDGESVMWQVGLADQFGQHGNLAGFPIYFAVPVEKVHNGQFFPINNPKDHIVFYQLNPWPHNSARPTIDQFGQHPVQTTHAVHLGVPTDKLAWQ